MDIQLLENERQWWSLATRSNRVIADRIATHCYNSIIKNHVKNPSDIANLEKLPVTGNAETNDPKMFAAPDDDNQRKMWKKAR